MDAPKGLRMLADVLDLRQSQGLEASTSTEVQEDLRKWASRWGQMESDLARLEKEWACMARACDNWRTWPGEAESDHDHPDWQAAARAILERNELRNQLKEYQNDQTL